MEFLIFLALLLLNYQFYKLSRLLLTIDQQSIDFGSLDAHVAPEGKKHDA